MKTTDLNFKYLVVPGVFLLVILVFIVSRNSRFLKANINEVLGSQITEDSTSIYDLSDSKKPASVLLYNQFSDRDFDGVLDQDDEINNKFALVKFSKNEEITFNGTDLKFVGIEDSTDAPIAKFLIDDSSEVDLKIDTTLIKPKLSLVGRDFFKSEVSEIAIVFLRTN